jgi:hypothetical protein
MMRLLLLFLAFIVTAPTQDVLSQHDYDTLRANLQVIPLILPDEPVDLSRGVAGERTPGIIAADDLGADYPQKAIRGLLFPKWRRYHGDGVSFDLPDHPQISIVRAKPRFHNPFNKDEAKDDDADELIANGYQVMFADHILVSVINEQSQTLDNSPGCFCGTIALDVFRFRDGVMRRFSLMENGEVKSLEAAVQQNAARLSEWTHSYLHPDVYTRIGLSLRPHGELFTREAAQAVVTDHHQMVGRIGLLYPGMPRDEVIAVMGAPSTNTDKRLRWHWLPTPSSNVSMTMEIEFDTHLLFQGWPSEIIVFSDKRKVEYGLFQDVPSDEIVLPNAHETEKEYGSVSWVLLHARDSISRKSAHSFLEHWITRLLPTLTNKDSNLLFFELVRLTERKTLRVSPDLLLLIQAFFAEHGGECAAVLLQEQIPDTALPLFITRLRLLITTPADERAHEEIPLLMSYIGEQHPNYAELATAFMTHPTPSIQRYGWNLTTHIKPTIIADRLSAAIVSPDYWTRFNVAQYLAKLPRQPEAILALVRGQQDKENDAALLDAWDRVLENDAQLAK